MHISAGAFAGSVSASVCGTAAVFTLFILMLVRRHSRSTTLAPPPAPIPSRPTVIDYLWYPQPHQFRARDYNLITRIPQDLVREYAHALRYHIQSFVLNTTWRGSDASVTAELCGEILSQHGYPITRQEQVLKALEIMRSGDFSARRNALTGLLSWLLVSNISLNSSSEWTLLSPILLDMAQHRRNHSYDNYGLWSWEKTRVFMANILWPDEIDRFSLTLNTDPPNRAAEKKLLDLTKDLFRLFLIENSQADQILGRCFTDAFLLGTTMQKDLCSWGWSYSGLDSGSKAAAEAALPAESLNKDKEVDQMGPSAVPISDFLAQSNIVLHPALIAFSDRSGLINCPPQVIVDAHIMPL